MSYNKEYQVIEITGVENMEYMIVELARAGFEIRSVGRMITAYKKRGK